MAWLVVGLSVFFALFCGVATWVRARRPDRTPEQTFKMWWTAWAAAGFFATGLILATGIIVVDVEIARPIRHVAVALAVAALLVAVAGGFIHTWAARRLRQLGADADYGDLDDLPPPKGNA